MSEAPRSDASRQTRPTKTIFGWNPYKVLFAMEYILQGLANPFQGITYQSFFKHFHFHYGLSEGATQAIFSRSYLAWSFKPVIGFFMDAFGKTRVALIILLTFGVMFYLITPFLDTSAKVFFWLMFTLSIFFACTDVAVDRATVITGDEESKSSGRSKAATVGLNQAICWAAIYGTSVVAGASGGWIADNVPMRFLLFGLAAVPALVLLVALRLPKDTAHPIPIAHSVKNFWDGLNTGPILWIIVFYFLFHFQPALGALWTNYLITTIGFSQTLIGYADGIAYFGLFLGVLWFAKTGIKWQDRFGLKAVFRVFIILSICVNLTQYVLVEPWFSQITTKIHAALPGAGNWHKPRTYQQAVPVSGAREHRYWLAVVHTDGSADSVGPLVVPVAQPDSATLPAASVLELEADQLRLWVTPGPADTLHTVQWSTPQEKATLGYRLIVQRDAESPCPVSPRLVPGGSLAAVRWSYYAVYGFLMAIVASFIRMSTFSLVGAVIPVNAAGSLFAGFMSVANLAYSFSYASGSWLYDNGLKLGVFRALQQFLFGIPSRPGDTMSIALLIFIGSMAYLLSFLAVKMLPDRRQTRATEDLSDYLVGPEHFQVLGQRTLRAFNVAAMVLGVAMLPALLWWVHLDVIAAVIVSFFVATFLRKVALDKAYARYVRRHRAS